MHAPFLRVPLRDTQNQTSYVPVTMNRGHGRPTSLGRRQRAAAALARDARPAG